MHGGEPRSVVPTDETRDRTRMPDPHRMPGALRLRWRATHIPMSNPCAWSWREREWAGSRRWSRCGASSGTASALTLVAPQDDFTVHALEVFEPFGLGRRAALSGRRAGGRPRRRLPPRRRRARRARRPDRASAVRRRAGLRPARAGGRGLPLPRLRARRLLQARARRGGVRRGRRRPAQRSRGAHRDRRSAGVHVDAAGLRAGPHGRGAGHAAAGDPGHVRGRAAWAPSAPRPPSGRARRWRCRGRAARGRAGDRAGSDDACSSRRAPASRATASCTSRSWPARTARASPATRDGFVLVDDAFRVRDDDDVFAVGDATAGALQAGRAGRPAGRRRRRADRLAARSRASPAPVPPRPARPPADGRRPPLSARRAARGTHVGRGLRPVPVVARQQGRGALADALARGPGPRAASAADACASCRPAASAASPGDEPGP